MNTSKTLRTAECKVVEAEWGSLIWCANAQLGNSDDITVGKCVIKPGCQNPVHAHPNCSEVLVVISGIISHTIENGKEVELAPGDTITLPAGLPHNARNIGEQDAVLFVAFSSADRKVEGV